MNDAPALLSRAGRGTNRLTKDSSTEATKIDLSEAPQKPIDQSDDPERDPLLKGIGPTVKHLQFIHAAREMVKFRNAS